MKRLGSLVLAIAAVALAGCAGNVPIYNAGGLGQSIVSLGIVPAALVQRFGKSGTVAPFGPRYAIPIHYGTFPLLRGTPAEFSSALGAASTTRVLVPEPGQKFDF
jgi:hypothetical protein